MGDRVHVLGGEKTFILSHLEVSEGEKQSPAKPPLRLQEMWGAGGEEQGGGCLTARQCLAAGAQPLPKPLGCFCACFLSAWTKARRSGHADTQRYLIILQIFWFEAWKMQNLLGFVHSQPWAPFWWHMLIANAERYSPHRDSVCLCKPLIYFFVSTFAITNKMIRDNHEMWHKIFLEVRADCERLWSELSQKICNVTSPCNAEGLEQLRGRLFRLTKFITLGRKLLTLLCSDANRDPVCLPNTY